MQLVQDGRQVTAEIAEAVTGAPHEGQQAGPRPAGVLARVRDVGVGERGQGAAEREGGEHGLGRAGGEVLGTARGGCGGGEVERAELRQGEGGEHGGD
ncbi:hypothetical protein ACWC2M_25775 [Streptomyces sp. NPDC001761]